LKVGGSGGFIDRSVDSLNGIESARRPPAHALHASIYICTYAGATALIEQGYPECGLELGAVILDVVQEADKEAGKGHGQSVPGDLVGRLAWNLGVGLFRRPFFHD